MTIRCKTCGKVLKKNQILSHYRKYHPKRLKGTKSKKKVSIKLTPRLRKLLWQDYKFYRKKGFNRSRALRKAWFGIKKKM